MTLWVVESRAFQEAKTIKTCVANVEVLGSPCSFSVCGCPERFVVDG